MNAVTVKRLDTGTADFAVHLRERLAWDSLSSPEVEARVNDILRDVRQRGDAAVLHWTNKFDNLQAADILALRIDNDRMKAALRNLPADQAGALRTAADRIRAYHEKQLQHSWRYTDADGSSYGQQITPLDRVGMYVPGGKASYPSTVLMDAIPARVAGVKEIIATLPTPGGVINDLVLAALALAEVDMVFTVGGGASDCSTGLWYCHDSCGRQDRWSRQYLRRHCQEGGVRQGRHRHGGGPFRNPGDLRWTDQSRLDCDGFVFAGRARRRRTVYSGES